MRVVLDTNILLVSVSSRSPFYPIYYALIHEGAYSLVVSQDILLEYEEIIAQQMNTYIARQTIKALENSRSVVIQNPTFHWHLIDTDPDDNKFVDCAVSGNADFIVTHDHHFDVLASVPFPVVPVISLVDFRQHLFAK